MVINLVDNRRYYLDETIKKGCIDKDIDGKTKYFCSKTIFNTIKKFPNPLTTTDLDGVEFLEQKDDRNSETLILKVVTKNNETYIQTGNMIGEFYFKNGKNSIVQINIGLRFDKDNNNNNILEYLINYANAIYPNEIELQPKDKNKKSNSIAKLMLSMMYNHSLSRAFVMGLPTYYDDFYDKGYNVKGKIDINTLISQELPFKGITPYIETKRVVEQNIGSILLKAIEIVEHNLRSFTTLSQIKSSLKQAGIKPIVTNLTIQKALNSKTLKNLAYSEYKNALNLAIMIIQGFKTPDWTNNTGLFYGYMTDISKIWENYLVKLLRTNISDDWEIEVEPKLKLFKDPPKLYEFTNVMYPDIVLKHKTENKVILFDAKFKQSNWFNREDFYKTATYISYYQNQNSKYDVILSGQIYPDVKADKINENLGFLDSDVDFRLMGIDLSNIKHIKTYEKCFIEIINKLDKDKKGK